MWQEHRNTLLVSADLILFSFFFFFCYALQPKKRRKLCFIQQVIPGAVAMLAKRAKSENYPSVSGDEDSRFTCSSVWEYVPGCGICWNQWAAASKGATQKGRGEKELRQQIWRRRSALLSVCGGRWTIKTDALAREMHMELFLFSPSTIMSSILTPSSAPPPQ